MNVLGNQRLFVFLLVALGCTLHVCWTQFLSFHWPTTQHGHTCGSLGNHQACTMKLTLGNRIEHSNLGTVCFDAETSRPSLACFVLFLSHPRPTGVALHTRQCYSKPQTAAMHCNRVASLHHAARLVRACAATATYTPPTTLPPLAAGDVHVWWLHINQVGDCG